MLNESEVALAPVAGTEADGFDMKRMGKVQELNVCRTNLLWRK
jgi:hypothetical protein